MIGVICLLVHTDELTASKLYHVLLRQDNLSQISAHILPIVLQVVGRFLHENLCTDHAQLQYRSTAAEDTTTICYRQWLCRVRWWLHIYKVDRKKLSCLELIISIISIYFDRRISSPRILVSSPVTAWRQLSVIIPILWLILECLGRVSRVWPIYSHLLHYGSDLVYCFWPAVWIRYSRLMWLRSLL